LLASQSEVKVLEYTNDFIYNVFVNEEKIYVAYLNKNKVFGYTKVYNQKFQKLEKE
jgi:hypothetical protein